MKHDRDTLRMIHGRLVRTALIVTAFAGSGLAILMSAHAATYSTAVEAEGTSPQGVAAAYDAAGASAGRAVRFGQPGTPGTMRPVQDPLYGVTIESVDNLADIVTALERHGRMPTTRIVFQEGTGTDHYRQAVDRIQPSSYIVGEILDSVGVADTTVASYRARSQAFVDAFGDKVDIWEIGNEVNGEWLVRQPQGEAQQQEVADKVAAAYDVVEARHLRSALTMSYFPTMDCRANDWEDMLWWARNRVPQRMKTGLDYVFVSWYEESCEPRIRPSAAEWNRLFGELRTIFPNSKLGFGEVGTAVPNGGTLASRQALLAYYYGLSQPGAITVPGYVGGYFWWNYYQEAVPWDRDSSIWPALESAFNGY